MPPRFSASTSAASSISGPRDVLTRIAPFFSSPSSAAPMMHRHHHRLRIWLRRAIASATLNEAMVTAMIPWNRLDAVRLEDGVELKLMQRGGEFSIMLGANELMNSRLSGSEEALASLAAEKLQARQAPRLLIGGLGMGFTLRAALRNLGPDAAITVARRRMPVRIDISPTISPGRMEATPVVSEDLQAERQRLAEQIDVTWNRL